MAIINTANLEKAAKEAAARVKECQNNLTARKNEAAAARKTANSKSAAYKAADTKRKTAYTTSGRAFNALKAAAAKDKPAKQKAYDTATANVRAADKVYEQAKSVWSSADKDAKTKEAAAKDAATKLTAAKQASSRADKALSDQRKANLREAGNNLRKAGQATKIVANKAINAVKKDPIGATAEGAKVAAGGVQDLALSGLSALANTKLLKGTKAGTTVDLIAGVGKMTDAWKDVGIDTIAALASGIYQGKTVDQISASVVAAAKKSAKGSVDDVVDKAMAALKAYDVNFSKQDLNKFSRNLKQYANAKMK